MKENFAGKFIVLDGPDGCGKSTQVRLLLDWLAGMGADAVSFRDPGTTRAGEKIRQILLEPSSGQLGTNVEVLLYMAARAQLWMELLGPALAAGKCVVIDRWLSSTCAYQGVAGGFGIERIIRMAESSLERVWPDITIVLDVDLKTSRQRLNRPLDRMESKGRAYHQKVREGFLDLCRFFEYCRSVDGSGPVEDVHRRVRETLVDSFCRER